MRMLVADCLECQRSCQTALVALARSRASGGDGQSFGEACNGSTKWAGRYLVMASMRSAPKVAVRQWAFGYETSRCNLSVGSKTSLKSILITISASRDHHCLNFRRPWSAPCLLSGRAVRKYTMRQTGRISTTLELVMSSSYCACLLAA